MLLKKGPSARPPLSPTTSSALQLSRNGMPPMPPSIRSVNISTFARDKGVSSKQEVKNTYGAKLAEKTNQQDLKIEMMNNKLEQEEVRWTLCEGRAFKIDVDLCDK